MSNTLTPFVYWAQTESQITLKVDLTDVKVRYVYVRIYKIFYTYKIFEDISVKFWDINIIFILILQDLNVNLKETTLQVTAYGQGARGLNNYSFNLNLHSPIDPNVRSKSIKQFFVYVYLIRIVSKNLYSIFIAGE